MTNELSLASTAPPIPVAPLFAGSPSPPDSPRSLRLGRIGVDTAQTLNRAWHSILPNTTRTNLLRNKRYLFFAAEHGGFYYAVAIWTDPVAANRFTAAGLLELRRLAICGLAPRYTATWMISKMIKAIKVELPDITRLISYQDTSVHAGTIYRAANWQMVAFSQESGSWHPGRPRAVVTGATRKARWEYVLRGPS